MSQYPTNHALRFVLLEDDEDQAEFYRRVAGQRSGRRIQLQIFHTEGEFVDAWIVNRDQVCQADAYIFDLMVKWTPDDVIPPHVQRQQHWVTEKAGIRCKDLVRTSHSSAPTVIWTVIETDNLTQNEREGCQICPKGREQFSQVLDRICNTLDQRPS